jgi:hypothetical protein
MKIITYKKIIWKKSLKKGKGKSYQIVDFVIVGEEGLSLSVLVLNESLDVQVEALRGGTLRRLRGQLAFLEQECQQREQRMSGQKKIYGKIFINVGDTQRRKETRRNFESLYVQ